MATKRGTRFKMPAYNIAGILETRDEIVDDPEVLSFMYTDVSGEDFADFVKKIASMLPKGISLEVLRDSCDYLLGQSMSRDDVFDLAWRLAGNVPRLKNGHPVLPWAGVVAREWMPVQITDVSVDYTRRGILGGRFAMTFLAGQAAGMETEKFWPAGYCHILAPRIGFDKFFRSQYPFQDIAEFTNLRMAVAVLPGEPELEFEEVHATPSAKKWNKRYIQMRARKLPGFRCPRKYPEDRPCFRCSYGQDKCPAAVRGESLQSFPCPQCERKRFFDPRYPDVCIVCHQLNLRKERSR